MPAENLSADRQASDSKHFQFGRIALPAKLTTAAKPGCAWSQIITHLSFECLTILDVVCHFDLLFDLSW
jgi:hypothetical protein